MERTKPSGRVIGIDLIPAQPPEGVATIQGNFLSPEVQSEVKRFVLDPIRGRIGQQASLLASKEDRGTEEGSTTVAGSTQYIKPNRNAGVELSEQAATRKESPDGLRISERVVDVVLSDMSAPK